jgi:hypothetical protein
MTENKNRKKGEVIAVAVILLAIGFVGGHMMFKERHECPIFEADECQETHIGDVYECLECLDNGGWYKVVKISEEKWSIDWIECPECAI